MLRARSPKSEDPAVMTPVDARRLALLLVTAATAAGCQKDDSAAVLRMDEMEQRYRPGLHTLMQQVQVRHAQLWFAGEAGNTALAEYQVHELEELLEDIAELHPEYDDMPIAQLLKQMLVPAVEHVDLAIRGAQDFATAFDRLTLQCNACHAATDRGAIVIQRPRTPPLDNLRYAPE
jgi:hypothetical protein